MSTDRDDTTRYLCAAAHLDDRFTGLRVNEQIVVAAEELIDHLDEAQDFLAGPSDSPYPLLRGQRVRGIRDRPLEWARFTGNMVAGKGNTTGPVTATPVGARS